MQGTLESALACREREDYWHNTIEIRPAGRIEIRLETNQTVEMSIALQNAFAWLDPVTDWERHLIECRKTGKSPYFK